MPMHFFAKGTGNCGGAKFQFPFCIWGFEIENA